MEEEYKLDFPTQAVLVRIDELEEKIREAKKIDDEFNDIKEKLKIKMKCIAEENNLDQIKWTTPKGTRITFSLGKKEQTEKQKTKEFDVEVLKEKFPEIYDQCLVEKEKLVVLEKGTNNVLRITL